MKKKKTEDEGGGGGGEEGEEEEDGGEEGDEEEEDGRRRRRRRKEKEGLARIFAQFLPEVCPNIARICRNSSWQCPLPPSHIRIMPEI